MDSGEIVYEKVHVSPRPPPKISFKDDWMKELGSEVAGGSEDSQRIQPKPKSQLYQERGDPWLNNSSSRRSQKMSSLVAKAPNTQERRDPWMDQDPSRAVCVNACTNCIQRRRHR